MSNRKKKQQAEDPATRWAVREIELACQKERESVEKSGEEDYGIRCYNSALRAYRSLLHDGHDGEGMSLTKGILNRLIDGKCLTPIEDTPDIWDNVTEDGADCKDYQCSRMSSLFKHVAANGTVTYSDVERVNTVNADFPAVAFHNGFCTRLVDRIFPITMPYFPVDRKYTVVREKFLVDPDGDDFDTVAFLYILTPAGKKMELNRYFKKDTMGQLTPIEEEEYEDRKARRVK